MLTDAAHALLCYSVADDNDPRFDFPLYPSGHWRLFHKERTPSLRRIFVHICFRASSYHLGPASRQRLGWGRSLTALRQSKMCALHADCRECEEERVERKHVS